MFEKNLEVGLLLDFYGDILPERRREMIELYYNDDLSLAEVAEQLGVTRQADEWRAIVVPQTVSAGTTLFSITLGGIPYKFVHRSADLCRSHPCPL